MIRVLAAVLALAAAPALAAGPGIDISGASTVGMSGFADLAALGGPHCTGAPRTRIDVTVTDPDGIAYAAIDLSSAHVRPVMSANAATWLWIPDSARPKRSYRWRFEEKAATRTTRTVPMAIDVVAGAGPIPAEIMAVDGKGRMSVWSIALFPAACR